MEGDPLPPGEVANGDGPVRTDVGALLRDRRRELGLELRDVVGSTRIRRVHLAAIEDGQFDQLPGHTYVVGFLRNYATFLGLDPDEVVRRYRSGNGDPPEPAYNPPKPIPEGGVPTGAIVLIALLLAALGYGGWYYLSATDRSVADLTGPLPQRLQELVAGWGGSDGAARDLAIAAVNPSATIAQAPLAPGMAVENGPAPPASVADVRLPTAAARPSTPPPVATPLAVAPTPPSAPGPSAPGPSAPMVVPAASAAVPLPAPAANPASNPAASPAAPVPAPRPAAGSASQPPAPQATAAPAPAPQPPAPQPPAAQAPAAPLLASRPSAAPPVPARPAPADEDGEGEVAPVTVELIGNRTAAPPPEGALPQPSEAPPQTAAAAAPPLDPNRVFGTTAGPARVVLRATSDSWIQVRDGAGELIFTRVLRSGEVYRVPDRPGLRMVTGNAGGLVISVDDRNIAPIGAPGQVMRDVVLDPARLLVQPGPATN